MWPTLATMATTGKHESTSISQRLGTGWTRARCLFLRIPRSTVHHHQRMRPIRRLNLPPGQYSSKFPYLSRSIEIRNQGWRLQSNYNALQMPRCKRATTTGCRSSPVTPLSRSLRTQTAIPPTTERRHDASRDKNNLRLNYGNGPNDIRHRFTFSPTYTIPGMKSPAQMLEGWSVNAIVTCRAGLRWNSERYHGKWTGWEPARKATASIGVGSCSTGITADHLGVQQYRSKAYSVLRQSGGLHIICRHTRP